MTGKVHAGLRRAAVLAAGMALVLSGPVAPTASRAQGVAGSLGSPAAAETPAQELANALSAIGMTNCAIKTLRVASFIFESGQAKFTVQPFGPDGNRGSTVIVIESSHPSNGATRLTTIMVTPDCSGFYEQVIYWPDPCEKLKATTFQTFSPPRALLKSVAVSELSAAVQLYLTTAGTGCMTVKKELFR